MKINACGEFTVKLWNDCEDIFLSITQSDFYSRMADGSLPAETFKAFLKQDILYLEEDAHAIKITADRAVLTTGKAFLNELYLVGIELERSLQLKLSQEFKLKPDKEMNPACRAYCRHLLHTAEDLSWEESAAALLPCYWVYQNAGLAASEKSVKGNPYQAWLDTYAKNEFSDYTERFIKLCEDIAARSEAETREKMITAFKKSVQCELDFILAFNC